MISQFHDFLIKFRQKNPLIDEISIVVFLDEGEREVQEVTLPTEKKEMRLQNHFHVEQQDDELDIINTTNVYFDGAYPPPNPRGTYGSLLTQGHLYFRSWNELQAQVMPLPVVPPTPTPEKVPFTEFHTSPPPPLPPVRPPRQKLNTGNVFFYIANFSNKFFLHAYL